MSQVVEKRWLLLLCAGAGAFFAGIFELSVRGTESLPMKIGETFRSFLLTGWDANAWLGIIFVVMAGMFYCLIKEPKRKREAAEIGLSIITIFMTFLAPLSSQSISGTETVTSLILPKVYAQTGEFKKGNLVFSMNKEKAGAGFNVILRDKKNDRIIRNENSSKGIYKMSDVRFGNYLVYIEADGQKWTKFEVEHNSESTEVEVATESSEVPLAVQRFVGTGAPKSLNVTPNRGPSTRVADESHVSAPQPEVSSEESRFTNGL